MKSRAIGAAAIVVACGFGFLAGEFHGRAVARTRTEALVYTAIYTAIGEQRFVVDLRNRNDREFFEGLDKMMRGCAREAVDLTVWSDEWLDTIDEAIGCARFEIGMDSVPGYALKDASD